MTNDAGTTSKNEGATMGAANIRRVDLWVGRTAAVVGLLYVALAAVWP